MIDQLRAGIFRLAWAVVRAKHRRDVTRADAMPPGVVAAAADVRTIMAATGLSQRVAADLYFRSSTIGLSAEQVIEYFLKHPEQVA